VKIPSSKEENTNRKLVVEEPESKNVKLSNILMKHSGALKLKNVESTLKEIAIKERKQLERMEHQEQMKKLTLGQIDERVKTSPRTNSGAYDSKREYTGQPDPVKQKKYAQTTKDMIQLMMENIEKNIEEDEGIQRRIRENKPLVVEKKKKEKFLKVNDELAKSTQLIQVRRDASKKIFDFSELVKINAQMAGVGPKGKLAGLLKKKASLIKEAAKPALG